MNKKVMKVARELDELKTEMEDVLFRMQQALRESPDHIRARAEAYWLPHITMAVSNDHGFCGGSMVTTENTIDELREEAMCGAEED